LKTINNVFGEGGIHPFSSPLPPSPNEKQKRIIFNSNFFQKLKKNMYIIQQRQAGSVPSGLFTQIYIPLRSM